MQRDLDLVLSYLTGRRLTGRDIYTALGMPKATYFSQRDGGRLHQPVNLLRLARAFNVNPVDLLVEYGHLTDEDVAEYQGRRQGPVAAPDKAGMSNSDQLSPQYPEAKQRLLTPIPEGGVQPELIVEVPVNGASQGDIAELVDALRQAADKLQGNLSEAATKGRPS